MKLFTLLAAQGVPAAETDDLVGALEAGGQCEVVEWTAWGRPLGAQ
ncbi:hypothetical protein ACFXKX_39760 [Streptomyces scopuliridis]